MIDVVEVEESSERGRIAVVDLRLPGPSLDEFFRPRRKAFQWAVHAASANCADCCPLAIM
ncbi:hypothetical protein [Micromonospora avicenniae]|uniref:hypothetical protein n=1 Tax=Micromonospora avicenniae TaxID=1198245 RepID=UPI00343F050A